MKHDDNNQNHYNEDTTYEYNDHREIGKDEDYNIDKDANDKYQEDQSTMKDKIVNKIKNNDSEDKHS